MANEGDRLENQSAGEGQQRPSDFQDHNGEIRIEGRATMLPHHMGNLYQRNTVRENAGDPNSL